MTILTYNQSNKPAFHYDLKNISNETLLDLKLSPEIIIILLKLSELFDNNRIKYTIEATRAFLGETLYDIHVCQDYFLKFTLSFIRNYMRIIPRGVFPHIDDDFTPKNIEIADPQFFTKLRNSMVNLLTLYQNELTKTINHMKQSTVAIRTFFRS